MPFTHIRLIAYEVPTCASYPKKQKDQPAKSGYPGGTLADPVADCAVDQQPNKPMGDAYYRLRRLAKVVDLAEQNLASTGVDTLTTLKVFMAPEFYFRPPEMGLPERKNMTYPLEDYDYIVEQLGKMFNGPRFANWLIVAGTLMCNATQNGREVFTNVAIVVKGGTNDPVQAIHKREPSGLDGVPWAVSTPGRDADYRPVHESWDTRRRNLFTAFGLTFGIEICLDHRTRTLRTMLAEWQKYEPATAVPRIQVQLLPAGGMGVMRDSLCAESNGAIFRNDGYASYADWSKNLEGQSASYRIRGYTGPPGTPLRSVPPGTAQYLPNTSSTAANLGWDMAIPKGPLQVPELLPGPAYTFPQRVRFWPREPLSPAAPPPQAQPQPVPGGGPS